MGPEVKLIMGSEVELVSWDLRWYLYHGARGEAYVMGPEVVLMSWGLKWSL